MKENIYFAAVVNQLNQYLEKVLIVLSLENKKKLGK